MRSLLRTQAYVCVECRPRQPQYVRRRSQSTVGEVQHAALPPVHLPAVFPPDASHNTKQPGSAFAHRTKTKIKLPSETRFPHETTQTIEEKQTASANLLGDVVLKAGALSLPQKFYLQAVRRLRQRLKAGIASAEPPKTVVRGLSFEDAVKATDFADVQGLDRDILETFRTAYKGQHASDFLKDTNTVRAPPTLQRTLLRRLGIRKIRPATLSRKIRFVRSDRRRRGALGIANQVGDTGGGTSPRRQSLPKNASHLARSFRKVMQTKSAPMNTVEVEYKEPSQVSKETKRSIPKLDSAKSQILRQSDVQMEPLALSTPTVPGLSFDLSRVLFNPGVYQLQDPRSRVYNFSPYLQRILPVTEFNFDALNEYITSSRDSSLRDLGMKHGKKYLGSSSSMTAVLAHFHFLLSAWRPVNVRTLSQSFTDRLRSFTTYQRGPSAIFLRWHDGMYAVDADKAYDSANILMSLGKSVEKLLTLEEDEFERYRKSAQEQGVVAPIPRPEAYHYTESGDFLLRSQLDAHDPRLPDSGMFDLKTRAVVSIRMNVLDHESGMGYEIQNRFGDFESYEKEYFDMIRSAFLKYSLQVRMGRMDGIFVAYHNIERIFGFQYVSLPEIDLHLHGTEDRTIGDTEFKLSLGLLNNLFNRVTSQMPNTSLRFHFETRDSTGAEGSFMYIFAEAQTEEEIEEIQSSKKAEIAEFEARIFKNARDDENASQAKLDTNLHSISSDGCVDEVTVETQLHESAGPKAPIDDTSERFSQPPADKLMGFVLRTRNKVDGKLEVRPENLTESSSWDVEYTLEELPYDRALLHYNLVRGRRAKKQNLKQMEPEDVAADYYLRKMKSLAEHGRHVRETIDRNDAGRPVIVLDRAQ